jgi:hypothetical protein
MKTKMKTLFIYASLGLITTVIFSACSKKDSTDDTAKDQPTAITLTTASSISEALYDDVFNQVSFEAEANNVSGRLATGCATVTLSPADNTTFPKTMTIDFGTGCTVNGITRKGKLIVNLTGKLRTAGSVLTVNFENYYVNEFKLEGTFSITNNTTTNALSFTTQTTNGKLTYPAGLLYYTHSGSHTYTQTAGTSTPSFLDDSWSVTGTGTTASSLNETLTVTIKTPLVKPLTCGAIVSGSEDFQYNSVSGSLNFGDGTCDRKATLTIGSFTKVIDF